MKRNQKKYTKKNRKGGAVNKLGWDASVSGINKKIDDVERRFDVISTKLGNVGSVNGPSRENDTRFDEAGYPEPTIGQTNPMNPNFASNPSTSGNQYNGSTPITPSQYDEVDNLNIKIKSLQKGPKTNRDKLNTLNGLKNALFAKYQKRVEYLEKEQRGRVLSQDESDQLNNLKANLVPNEPFGGGRKSRRYRKSKRTRRTRKYKK